MIGEAASELQGSDRESLVQYHRPLMEDGVLSYEFLYEPGSTEVHPALDRMAFMLEPKGLSLHWLTAAEYEQTELSPQNRYPLEGVVPGDLPLKVGDWNAVSLQLTRSTLAVVLNDKEIAKVPLPENNNRTLGFFRYKDATGARIRKIIHRGAWPKSLPEIADQELTAAGE